MSIDFDYTPPKGLIPYPDERKARGDIILLLRKHYSEDGHETGTGQDIHNPHADSPTQSASERLGSQPSYDSDEYNRLGESDPEAASALFEDYLEQKRSWDKEIKRALSRGELTQAEAEALGHYVGGHATDSGWQPLPDDLYHVTTAWTAVDATGLKSRDDLAQDRGKGLGGGESDTISFTADIEVAKQIKTAMLEAHQVARGEKTIEDMVAEAKEGGFYDEMLKYWNGKDDRLMEVAAGPREITNDIGLGWGDAPDGDLSKRPRYAYSTEQINEKVGRTDWEPVRTITNKETGEEAVVSVKYTQTQNEWRDAVFDIYKTFAAYREFAGGAMNPLFFSTDVPGLAAIDPSEIAIVHAKPKSGAQGYQLSALGEWRTADGAAVEVQGMLN